MSTNPKIINLETARKYIAKAEKLGACKGNLVPVKKAFEANDLEEVLAVARGNKKWVSEKLGLTLRILGDGLFHSYHKNGKLWKECTYIDGKREGL